MEKKTKTEKQLRIIPLGGLNEIGKNITAIEYGNDILVVDCGMAFPEEDMLGIDVVIPDFTYLVENAHKVRGVVVTHGHEDHIGGIPYLLQQINVPIYGTGLTLGLVRSKLEEHGLTARLLEFPDDGKITLGCFKIEAIHATHSVAGAVCLAITTPVGVIFHTGDFKIDYTPLSGMPMDLARVAQIGRSGVLLLMADSTNATRKGYTPSEILVKKAIREAIENAKQRIILATFSSNVDRIQCIIDNAVECGRQVAISGRSMENVVNIALELGYIKAPPGTLVDISKIKGIPDNKLVIVTTGSQGEPMSALVRMANAEHKQVQIKQGDTVVLSSSPVPGNERMVSDVINSLFEKGANVIYSGNADIHVSGHASQEELKLLHSLIRPKFFVPVHGEYRHLVQHQVIAKELGMSDDHIQILANGDVLTLTKRKMTVSKEDIPVAPVFVDGLGVGDVGSVVLKDRRQLSSGGLIIVAVTVDVAAHMVVSGPDIISRGFVYVRESDDLLAAAKSVAEETLANASYDEITDWNTMRTAVRNDLRKFIYAETGRTPVILPIFMQV